jgi:PAS domain S-box-containing protein
MGNIFSRPVFSDPEKTRGASNFFTTAWSIFGLATFSLIIVVAVQPTLIAPSAEILFALSVTNAALLELSRRGRTTEASWLFVIGIIAILTARAAFAGGIQSPGVRAYLLFALMAGMMLGFRAGITVATACVLLSLGLVSLELNGALPARAVTYSPLTSWLLNTLYMGVAMLILRLATTSTAESNKRLKAELTERKRAEGHLNVALEAGAIGIWEGGLASYYTADERAFSMFGLSRPPDGRLALEEWAKLIHTDDAPQVQAAIDRLLSGTSRVAVEYRIIRPYGAVRHIEAIAASVQRGPDRTYVGTVVDVTQRKFLEERSRHSQKMEAMGTLAGGIAHDFNNLLGAIQSFAQLLEEDTKLASRERHFAQRITAACERGRDIVKQIISFARRGAQQMDVIDLCSFVAEYKEILARTLPDAAKLEISCPEETVCVRANPGQLSQLISNLCKNAAEALAGRTGEVRLQISSALPGEIKSLSMAHPLSYMIGVSSPGERYACLQVSDEGTGIEPDALKQIFDPFFTTRGQRGGTGLGLSVVHGVVESHGGFGVVESTVGKGTTISIYLPQVTEVPTHLSSSPAAAGDLRGTERILILDDEPDITDSLSLSLDRLGYGVVAVNDPLEALEIIREDPGWDAIVSDYVMPGKDGVEVTREFKKHNPSSVAILCSGYTEKTPDRSADVVDLFLDKPVQPSELVSRLRHLFERRNAVPEPETLT